MSPSSSSSAEISAADSGSLPHDSRAAIVPSFSRDWRHLENGIQIPLPSGYLDQPYFVRADDGALVLVCTNCPSHEGEPGQNVVCIRSEDDGASWTPPVPLEPPGGVEASYAVILKTSTGRIYVFYNHNTDNIREVPCDRDAAPDGVCRRVDSLGHFVFKFSDDHGRTWTRERFEVPVREFAIDRENSSQGRIRYFWTVGKAFWHRGRAYVPLHKVGGFGKDFFTRSEGCLICITNLDTESDPAKLDFLTYPEGDVGIRAPAGAGPVGEEHSFTVLSDGSLFTVFRTIAGAPACAYSRDDGRSWSESDFLRYPDGRVVKNPRAANFIWRLSGGRYLYWFHNHSGRNYADRNPVWCLFAREVEGPDGCVLEFSQPEVLLYTDDITCRMSYPDTLELPCGDVLLTETEKHVARMHRLPAEFLRRAGFHWSDPPLPDEASCLLEDEGEVSAGRRERALELRPFWDRNGSWEAVSQGDLRAGFSLDLQLDRHTPAGALLDNRDRHGRGFALSMGTDRRLRVILADKRGESHWKFDTLLPMGEEHFVCVTVDGGPKIITGIFNGLFDDGGERQFGFGLFHPNLEGLNGRGVLAISSHVRRVAVYDRPLLTAEALALQARHTARIAKT